MNTSKFNISNINKELIHKTNSNNENKSKSLIKEELYTKIININMNFSNENITPNNEQKQINEKFIYIEYLNLIHNKKYKRVHEDINSKTQRLRMSSMFIQFIELKIICCIKIINNKLNQTKNQILHKKTSVLKWFERLESGLIQFKQEGNLIYNNHTLNEEYIEYYSNYLLLLGIFYKEISNMSDSLACFSLGYQIISIFTNKITRPSTFIIFQYIIIQISTLILSDSDYFNALKYQEKGLNLCYKYIFYMSDIKKGVNIEMNILDNEVNKELVSNFKKVIINLITFLFHYGISNEAIGNLNEAVFNYTQACFFYEKFLLKTENNDNVNIVKDVFQFLSKVKNRANECKETILHLQREIKSTHLKEDNKIEIEKKEKIINETKRKSYDVIKFKVENLISMLNINRKSDNTFIYNHKQSSNEVKHMISTNNLINFLLSKDFCDNLKDLKAVNTTIIKSNDLLLIQKKISELRNNELLKLKKKSQMKNWNLDKSNIFSKSHIKNDKIDDFQSHIKNYKEIKKYPHSDYLLSKKYRMNYSLLESASNKEIQFHRSILKIKKIEEIPMDFKTKEEILKNTKEYFEVNLRNRKKILFDNDKDNFTREIFLNSSKRSLNMIKYDEEPYKKNSFLRSYINSNIKVEDLHEKDNTMLGIYNIEDDKKTNKENKLKNEKVNDYINNEIKYLDKRILDINNKGNIRKDRNLSNFRKRYTESFSSTAKNINKSSIY